MDHSDPTRIIRVPVLSFLLAIALCRGATGRAQELLPPPIEAGTALPIIKQALVIPTVGRYGRDAIYLDFLEAQMARADWRPPREGDEIAIPGNVPRNWAAARFADDGTLTHDALRGGYAYAAIDSPAEQVLMLETRGSGIVYLNGEPRAGDPYGNGLVRLPVHLKAGVNHLLAHCYRGGFTARFAAPPAKTFLEARDATLPNLLREEVEPVWGAVMVVNATTEPVDGLRLSVAAAGGQKTDQAVPYLPPLATRKVPLRFAWRLPDDAKATEVACTLRLVGIGAVADKTLSQLELKLPLQSTAGQHQRTFISEIDGSVQYYSVLPARRPEGEPAAESPALFLTLHGAGVEATGQAAAYSPKSWGHVVAATNRRPFGFDWEDWGRMDALEVLADATKRLKVNPRRTYLTGHSMGGHGVWHLGATYPDRFAALGPSAGWISFFTYGVGRPKEGGTKQADAIQRLMGRARGGSETLNLVRNYASQGVYVLHGERDDNVPVDQARTMRKQLAEFHRDFAYYEQPGAGHWWDGPVSAGADCVDWEPMFDFFRRHVSPADRDVRHISFTTANPGISSRCRWATIEAQLKQGEPSTIDLVYDPAGPTLRGTTQNVQRLSLDVEHWPADTPGRVVLDGSAPIDVTWPADGKPPRIWLTGDGTAWKLLSAAPSGSLKGPLRYGPFKEAFRNRVLFVYGTRGTLEENAWALAKARFDAETFWYRGNGSVDVIPDSRFSVPAAGPPSGKPAAKGDRKEPARNVILYGNADTNSAWAALLRDCPIQVQRGKAVVDKRELTGDDLVCLFCWPRWSGDEALIGVVAPTGSRGQRAAQRANYFVSGSGYPDLMVYGADALSRGTRGVRLAGFFGNDWSFQRGEWAWNLE
jgi:poly(3-hydroxybutyrate) depolymerase